MKLSNFGLRRAWAACLIYLLHQQRKILVGLAVLFLVFMQAPVLHAQDPVDFAGHWEGKLEIPGSPLPFNIDLSYAEGKWSGTADSPQQGAMGMLLADIRADGPDIQFSVKDIPGQPMFKGKLEGGKIIGIFSQAGQNFPLTFNRQAAVPAAGGDETEAKSTPEAGTPVTLKTTSGTIHGTMLFPDGTPPFPVVLIIAGSGPTDRDGNNPLIPGANNSLKMISETLVASGIASVRYDKRGVAESTAAGLSEQDLRFEHYVDDAAAWGRQLRADDRFAKIGIIGHSEGSLIGMIAAREVQADAYVSIAGIGRPAHETIEEQLADQPEKVRQESQRITRELLKGNTVSDVDSSLLALYRPSIQPYLISWFKYDPAQEIAKLQMPVQIILGTTDIQVPVKDGESLAKAKPDARLAVIKGMNHILKEAPADRMANIGTYSDPKLPLMPEFVDKLTEFLTSSLGKK